MTYKTEFICRRIGCSSLYHWQPLQLPSSLYWDVPLHKGPSTWNLFVLFFILFCFTLSKWSNYINNPSSDFWVVPFVPSNCLLILPLLSLCIIITSNIDLKKNTSSVLLAASSETMHHISFYQGFETSSVFIPCLFWFSFIHPFADTFTSKIHKYIYLSSVTHCLYCFLSSPCLFFFF